MKENSIKNERSSIKEDIKILEKKIEDYKPYKNIEYCSHAGQILQEEHKALEHILSDYKRVLKENEELKQDRNNNYQMIALAQNEVLGYMQGYEDGKKLKRSAVECVVENQKYYLIRKEIEHYKEYIEKLQKENEGLRKKLNEENKRCMMLAIEKQDYFEKYRYHLQQNESLTKEFSNVILVQKVKDKIIHYQELQDNYIKKYDEINEGLQAMINVLQELIEEREEK